MAGEGGRDDGVDCVAALLEHPCPGRCFLDVTARDDAPFGDDLRPARRDLATNHRCLLAALLLRR
jgi:hypothetical protein